MDDWRNTFSDYTTGQAFNLSLTRRMVAKLIFIQNYPPPERGLIRLEDATTRSLQRRGLVTLTVDKERTAFMWKLTPAGEHVYELLRMAGLVELKEAEANSA